MKTKKLFLMAAMLLMGMCTFAQSKYLYIGPVEPTAENYKTLATEVTSYNDYYEYENNTGEKCYVYVLVAEDISVSMRDPALGWIGHINPDELTSANIPGHKVVRSGRLAIGGRTIIDLGDEWKHFYLGTTQPTAGNYEALTPAFSSLPAMDGATVQVPSSGKIYLLVPYSNSPSQSLLKHCFINNEGKTVTYTERNCDNTSIYRHYIWELSFEPGTVLKYNYLTEGFNNQTLYTLTCKHGALVMNAEGTGLAAGQTRTDAPEEDKRFAIITYNGKRYLYSPSVKQYLLADGSFVSRLGSPITFDDSKSEGEYKFMLSTPGTNGETWYFNNNNGNIVINSWGTPDDGNRWLIEACVVNIDLSEALALAAEQPVTVTAENKTMTYGDDVPALTYKSSGATLNGTPKLSTTATKTSPVGTYPIKVEKGTVINEQVTYVNGTLTIGKAPLTVGVQNMTITEGDAIPTFTLTYSGWRNNDKEATAFTTKPTATTTATSASKPGTYPITVSGGAAQNYALTYTQGTLTIKEKEKQPIAEGIYELTVEMFHLWDDCTATAKVAQQNGGGESHVGEAVGEGSLIYGVSSVYYLRYADLTDYDKLVIIGTPGIKLRVLMNRKEVGNGGGDENGGSLTEVKPVIGDDGLVVVPLTDNDFAHLNAIKTDWSTPSGTVKRLALVKGNPDMTPLGIDQLSDGLTAKPIIYNLGGQRLEKPRKGINIIGGKKVFVP